MKIYLVTRIDTDIDYEQFLGLVCKANSSKEVKDYLKQKNYSGIYQDLSNVKIEVIGTNTLKSDKVVVYLASHTGA